MAVFSGGVDVAVAYGQTLNGRRGCVKNMGRTRFLVSFDGLVHNEYVRGGYPVRSGDLQTKKVNTFCARKHFQEGKDEVWGNRDIGSEAMALTWNRQKTVAHVCQLANISGQLGHHGEKSEDFWPRATESQEQEQLFVSDIPKTCRYECTALQRVATLSKVYNYVSMHLDRKRG